MKKTVLVVEDDKDLVEIFKYIAQTQADNVIVESHRITLPEIEKMAPNLILLDHWLPVSSGGDLCRQIKNNEQTRHIPVILISATVNLQELAAFCQADDYVAKPFDVEELTEKIKSFLKD